MQVATDSNSKTESIPVLDPNDTGVLIAKAAAQKLKDLGELARIHVSQLPTNVRELEEFLVRTGSGQWLKYSTAAGSYVPVSDDELKRMSDPHRYALQGPLSSQRDGSKDFYLFRKGAA